MLLKASKTVSFLAFADSKRFEQNLRAMKRPYTKEKLFGLISQLRERIPSMGYQLTLLWVPR
jgi:hypothetical protein